LLICSKDVLYWNKKQSNETRIHQSMEEIDRYWGCLIGLAAVDALGTTTLFDPLHGGEPRQSGRAVAGRAGQQVRPALRNPQTPFGT
jgi:hypothetical protein